MAQINNLSVSWIRMVHWSGFSPKIENYISDFSIKLGLRRGIFRKHLGNIFLEEILVSRSFVGLSVSEH